MKLNEKSQLFEQLKEIRQGNDNAQSIVINATSGEIKIINPIVVNSILDYLLKELHLSLVREIE